jgi:branched-chain amino acid transport system permease protein
LSKADNIKASSGWLNLNFFIILFAFIFLLLLPAFAGSYVMHLMILVFLYAYLGQSWNILGGYAGQLSLGHATFLGLGAYTSTLLFMHFGLTPWVGIFAGALIATICGLLIGFLSFHFGLKSHFFALATIAFAEIFRLIALSIESIGGAQGLLVPLKGNSPYLFQFNGKAPYYYIIFAMMIICTAAVHFLNRSKYGFYFVAIRENEDAAKALGVNTLWYKMVATAISAFFTAMGGTFYAQYVLYIDPPGTFGVLLSVDIVLRAIIGGTGTILGPIIGSFVLSPLSEIIQSVIGVGKSGVYMMVYGAILMAVCILMPNGIYPFIRRFFKPGSGLKNRTGIIERQSI